MLTGLIGVLCQVLSIISVNSGCYKNNAKSLAETLRGVERSMLALEVKC